MLMFQTFIHSWVCYECLKLLFVFGLQPNIQEDINLWSQDLHAIFNYYSNKSGKKKHLDKAAKLVAILFDQTDHFFLLHKTFIWK